MMIKVLILGSGGMLGHKLYYYLKKNSNFIIYNFSATTKLNSETILIDALDQKKLTESIKKINPDLIINCVGLLIQDSHNKPDLAVYLNSYLPLLLEEILNENKSKLIHISTDCVFSGDKKSSYEEEDFKDATDIYGLSKSLGEQLGPQTLVLRTSIIGPELKKTGTGLFNWFMSQSGSIEGYKKMIWSGVTTLELSKAIYWAINNEISGIYHITNNLKISKNDLISLIKLHTRKSIKIIPVEGNMSDKSLIDTRALLNYEIPSYDEMVREMIADISKSINLYKHYKL
jgi:dTDP-4-dehydrorhamnose reductase